MAALLLFFYFYNQLTVFHHFFDFQTFNALLLLPIGSYRFIIPLSIKVCKRLRLAFSIYIFLRRLICAQDFQT